MERFVAVCLALIGFVGCESQPAPEPSPPAPGVSTRIHPDWNAALGGLFAADANPRVSVRTRGVDSDERLLTHAEPRVPGAKRRFPVGGHCLGGAFVGSREESLPIPTRPLAPILPWGDPMSPSGNVIALRLELEPAWVLIDVGSIQNVEAGHVFEVRRHGVQIARLVIDEVVAGQSAGRIHHAADARRVRLGDQVHFLGVERRSEERLDWTGWPEIPVPSLRAEVVATSGGSRPQFVLLDIGADDLVEPGFQFTVYRGATFVAKVVVERVLRDSAGCRVLFRATGQRVQPGDVAATRLD